jgi:hypothetical protein
MGLTAVAVKLSASVSYYLQKSNGLQKVAFHIVYFHFKKTNIFHTVLEVNKSEIFISPLSNFEIVP